MTDSLHATKLDGITHQFKSINIKSQIDLLLEVGL